MKKSKPETATDGSMSLSGHLKEMRNRLIVVLLVFIVSIVVCFAYADELVKLLTDMGTRCGYDFVYLKPQELLMVYFSFSLLGGLVIDFPIIAYEIFAFCSPGLKPKEKTFMLFGMVFGTVFFCIGVLFAYKITLPFMLRFLIGFSNESIISASISIQEYISFLLLVFLIFGIIFELPVLSVILTSLGIIKPVWLVKARKVMIVAIFFLAAIITPPDIVSQVMVAIPIVLLYELSIILSKVFYSFKKKDKETSDAADEETA